MDKEEILKKSRDSKTDEGEVYAENKGRRYGEIAFCTFVCAIMIFDLIKGVSAWVPLSVFWAYTSAEAYGRYRISKNRKLLVSSILGAIAAVCFLACHVVDVMGIGA